MIRKIIKIDKEKCNGCGICVSACHEGAIGMVHGKAELLRDDYCDGLGDCLPACPTNAITFEEREAMEYNEAEVKRNMEQKNMEQKKEDKLPCGCPGTNARAIKHEASRHEESKHGESKHETNLTQAGDSAQTITSQQAVTSELGQWPVQIKLVPVNAPYFENANLLVSADCAAYAYGNFHQKFMRNKITLIGCPKLDEGDYSDKLTAILKENNIKSVTVVRMEVPCCGGIENAVKTALKNCGKMIPWQVATISTDGSLLD